MSSGSGESGPRAGLACPGCSGRYAFLSSPGVQSTVRGNRSSTTTERNGHMANMDEAKGRAKRAAGELTGDEEMKREGTIDKASGKAKDAIDGAGDAVKDRIGKKD